MTRSAFSPYSPEVAKKTFRAKAKQEGITFKAAAEARTKLISEQQKILFAPGTHRRNHGRMDGTRWNGKGFICPRNVDGQPQECECEYCTLDVDSDWEDEDKKAPRIVVLSSLLDIAKPAKPKGVAKEFEVVDSLPRVIALYDDEFDSVHDWGSDIDEVDWEEIYGFEDKEVERKESYSAVLKGKERGDVVDGP